MSHTSRMSAHDSCANAVTVQSVVRDDMLDIALLKMSSSLDLRAHNQIPLCQTRAQNRFGDRRAPYQRDASRGHNARVLLRVTQLLEGNAGDLRAIMRRHQLGKTPSHRSLSRDRSMQAHASNDTTWQDQRLSFQPPTPQSLVD